MIPWLGDSAKVIHVSKSGNDNNGGVAQQYPVSLANDSKLTIGAAVTACPDGGTIIIWPGDYVEKVNLDAADKAINLIGTNRMKCRILPSSGNAGIALEDGCTVQNLYVYSINQQAIIGTVKKNFTVSDCYLSNGGANALCFNYSDNVLIKRCYVFSKSMPIYAGNNTIIEDCFIIGDGTYTGIPNNPRLISGIGDISTSLILRNSLLLMQPSYQKGTDLYQVSVAIKGIYGIGRVIIENCDILIDGSKPGGANPASYFDGDAYGIHNCDYVSIANSRIHTITDQNKSKTAYSLYLKTKAQLLNCSLTSAGQSASYDLYASSARVAVLTGCNYDSSKVHSNVTVQSAMDPNGPLIQAAKSIVNKAVQNKITGAIDYYDDDGQTIILTQTPTEAESTITRTPS